MPLRLFYYYHRCRFTLFCSLLCFLPAVYAQPHIHSITTTQNSTDLAHSPNLQLTGTFIQLLSPHTAWSTTQWNHLFQELKRLKIKRLIIQWTAHQQTYFFPSPHHLNNHPTLEYLLQAADEIHIDVWVGLVEEPDFWKKISDETPVRSRYLQELLAQSSVVAKELVPLLKPHPSFKGWYITQEIDDLNWRTTAHQALLFQYINALSTQLKRLSPNTPIAISGFVNKGTDPAFLEDFWNALLLAAPAIQEVLFQDGIGVHKQSFQSLPPYLQAMQRATNKTSRKLNTVVEIFEQTQGYPINNLSFQAIPATVDRIQEQLVLASLYSEESIGFSIPEYMLSSTDAAQKILYQQYINTILHSPNLLPLQ
jgi:Domain of unknown function (DUF4434)